MTSNHATGGADGRLLTLDPGNGCTGAALFDRGELTAAWAICADLEVLPCATCPLCRAGASCAHLARSADLVRALLASVPELPRVDVCAVEVPAYWKSTPDMPGLLSLARTAGALLGAMAAIGVHQVLAYEPRSWKGTTAKDQHQRETLAALTEAERERLPRRPLTRRFQPDAVDAAGLGLFLLRRNGRFLADPATFAELVEVPPARGGRRGKRTKRRAPAQGGFTFATGPSGTPAALHADDVDAVLDQEHGR